LTEEAQMAMIILSKLENLYAFTLRYLRWAVGRVCNNWSRRLGCLQATQRPRWVLLHWCGQHHRRWPYFRWQHRPLPWCDV